MNVPPKERVLTQEERHQRWLKDNADKLDQLEELIAMVENRCDKRHGPINEHNEYAWLAYRSLLLQTFLGQPVTNVYVGSR